VPLKGHKEAGGGRRQEAGGRRQEAGGRRQEEAGGRREEGGGRQEGLLTQFRCLILRWNFPVIPFVSLSR
jgi:hypothetical protein